MSASTSPEMGDSDTDQTQSGLLRQILGNQEAIQGLSDKLMPLLVSNLQRLAESNRPNNHPPQDSGTDGQAPRDPRHSQESAGQGRPAHVVSSGKSDARMRGNSDGQHWGNAAQGYGNVGDGNSDMCNAAQNYQGNAAQNYQGNAAQNYQGNAAQFTKAMQPVLGESRWG